MSDRKPADFGETATVEVRMFRSGELIDTELCETIEEAAALVVSEEEVPGVECEVEDLSAPSPSSGWPYSLRRTRPRLADS